MFIDPDEPEEESNLTAKSLISSIYAFTDLHMRWFGQHIYDILFNCCGPMTGVILIFWNSRSL